MQKSAFITGGAVRLGRNIAFYLAHQGWDIALHYHSSQYEAEKLQQEILNIGVEKHCKIFQADFTQSNDFSDLIDKVYQEFPNLQLLVNNASIYKAASIEQTSVKMWEHHFNVNVQAPFFLIKAFAKKLLLEETLSHRPNIVNILDNKISFSQYHYAAYVLSKKTLAELTYMAALEFAPQLRVNAISPGIILPIATRSPEYLKWRIEGVPLKKKGSVDNILLAMDYILKNEFLTGQVLTVDGGENLNSSGKNFSSFSEIDNHIIDKPTYRE